MNLYTVVEGRNDYLQGYAYLKGWGVEKDVEKAKALFEKACQVQNSGALFQLGKIYEKENNFTKSFDCYQEATKQKIAKAFYRLGLLYLNGQGVGKDESKALQHFEEAATLGYDRAGLHLQQLRNSQHPLFIKQEEPDKLYAEALKLKSDDWEKANNLMHQAANLGHPFARYYCFPDNYKYMKEAADAGLVEAQFHYGKAIYKGKLFSDYTLALPHLEAAANQGCLEAHHYLGYFYMKEKKCEKAIKHFQMAEPSSPGSSFELGHYYDAKKDFHKAVQHFRKGLEKIEQDKKIVSVGNVEKIYLRSAKICYFELKDYGTALKYFEKADPDKRDMTACYLRGNILNKGYGGIPVDHAKAFEFFNIVVQKNWLLVPEKRIHFKEALFFMGHCLVYGLGMPIDQNRGIKLLKESKDLGFKPASTELAKLETPPVASEATNT